MSDFKSEEKAQFIPHGHEDTFTLSEGQLNDLISQIRKDLDEGIQDKQPWLQERVTDNKAYYGIKKNVDWPFRGAAKISSQMHRIMVDTTKANLLASVSAPNDLIAAETSKAQTLDNAKYVQDLHNALAKNEYGLLEILDAAWHPALVESFVVLKPVYQNEVVETVHSIKRWLPQGYATEGLQYNSATDTVMDKDGNEIPSFSDETLPDTGEEGLEECTIEVTLEHNKEGLKWIIIPGANIYLPVSSPGDNPSEKYQRASYLIEEDYRTVQEMKMWQEEGKIKNFEIMDSTLQSIYALELRNLKEKQAGIYDFTKHVRHVCRNLWWNGKFEYKGKLREIQVYINTETWTVLKIQVNTFGIRPYFPQVPFPVPETPFGESEPKQIRELVTELELILNTLINMGLIKAYPPKFYDPLSGFDPKTLGAIGPNSYIPVRDPSRNVFMPPQPEDPRVLMEMAKFVMDLIERATANSDTVQGQSAPTNSTKYEIQQKLVRAGVRFDMIYKRLKDQLKPAFEYTHLLLLRFMPLEKEIELMGEQAVVKDEQGNPHSRLKTIYMQEGKHGLSLKGNSVMEEQQKAQDAKELLTLAAMPPYNAYISFKPESPYYLLFNLIQRLNPVAMDKILAKPEEVAQLMRDRAKVQNEQEQAAVEEGKQQGPPPEVMKMQMEMQMKMQEAQMNAEKQKYDLQMEVEKHQSELKMKEQEHDQKMRHLEEANRLKLELMKKESDARASATKNNKPAA